jgi:hypothetical protein
MEAELLSLLSNIKQEKEAEPPTSVSDENNSSNSAAEQPDSVENKVSF